MDAVQTRLEQGKRCEPDKSRRAGKGIQARPASSRESGASQARPAQGKVEYQTSAFQAISK